MNYPYASQSYTGIPAPDFLNKSNDSTGAATPTVQNKLVVATTALCLLFGSSTGVFAENYTRTHKPKYSNSYVCNPCLDSYTIAADSYTRTPAEDIERIREIIDPAVSDLAKSFGVSRQAIYNWLRGDQPSEVHTEKIQDLALAADVFANSGIEITGTLLKRKLHSGRGFFDAFAAGESAEAAAKRLIEIAKKEQTQRDVLAARFAGRTTPKTSADVDLMAENDLV